MARLFFSQGIYHSLSLYKVISMLVLSLFLDHSQGLGPVSLGTPPSA